MLNNCKSLHNDCMEIIESICEEFGNNAQTDFSEKINNHLKQCPGCEAYLKSLEKTLETYKCCKQELPSDLAKKVIRRLEHDPI